MKSKNAQLPQCWPHGLWRRLTEPAAQITEPSQRRQAQLLTTPLIALISQMLVSLAVTSLMV